MTAGKKIDVLVIPDLFPKYPGDLQGIFVLDYLKSTAPYCNNSVLFLKISGKTKGFSSEQTESANIYRYNITSNAINSFLKPFYYFLLFIKGYRMGKQFTDAHIIHAHGTILSGTLSYLLSKKLKIPFVITEHTGPFSVISGSSWKKNWAKFILQKANKVLVVSEHLKKEIAAAGIQPLSMEVSYNPVDTDLFKLRQETGQNKIVFVGRLDIFKGALRSLKAFDAVDEEVPDWSMVIVGEGEDLNPIKTYLNANPVLKSKVTLTGFLQKEEIAQIFKDTSFLIFPSRHESFGLVIAEALSAGIPVITGNLTAPKEFVNAYNGLLVSPDSIEEITDGIKTMIKTHKFYDSNSIREEIVEKFGFAAFGESLYETYRTLIK